MNREFFVEKKKGATLKRERATQEEKDAETELFNYALHEQSALIKEKMNEMLPGDKVMSVSLEFVLTGAVRYSFVFESGATLTGSNAYKTPNRLSVKDGASTEFPTTYTKTDTFKHKSKALTAAYNDIVPIFKEVHLELMRNLTEAEIERQCKKWCAE